MTRGPREVARQRVFGPPPARFGGRHSMEDRLSLKAWAAGFATLEIHPAPEDSAVCCAIRVKDHPVLERRIEHLPVRPALGDAGRREEPAVRHYFCAFARMPPFFRHLQFRTFRALARGTDRTALALARGPDRTAPALARGTDSTARALARGTDTTARALARAALRVIRPSAHHGTDRPGQPCRPRACARPKQIRREAQTDRLRGTS
jgi:hypothetical protein